MRKWLVILGVVIMLIIGSLGLALTYFFPADLVRQELERQLSSTLNGHATIAALSFNLLTGLELRRVTVHRQEQPILSLQRLNLDYSLWGLLRGKLLINEILIDHAKVDMSLPDLAPTPSPAPPPSQPSPEPSTLPVLPLAVNLQAFLVKHAHIDLRVSPTLVIALKDMHLDLSGAVDEHQAELEGTVNISDATIDIESRRIRLPVHLAFAFSADLPQQRLELQQLDVASPPAVQTSFSGQVNDFLATPSIDLTMHEIKIDIQPLLAMTQAFLPPDVASLPLSGMLTLAGHVEGVPGASGFQGVVDLTVAASALKGALPARSVALSAADLSLHIDEFTIKDNIPQYGKLAVTLSDADFQYDTVDAREVELDLTGEYFAVGPFSSTINASGTIATLAMSPSPLRALPFAVHLDTAGNHKSLELMLNDLTATLGEFITLYVKGDIRPVSSPIEGFHVSLATRLEPRLTTILPLVPASMLSGITIQKGNRPDVIVVDVDGLLDAESRPHAARVSTGINLSDLTVSLESLSAGATLNRMNTLITASYRALDGGIQGTVGTRLDLSDVHHGGSVDIGQTQFTLKSDFHGTVEQDFTPVSLHAQDTVTIDLRELVYDLPSLKADLDRLTIKTETVEDLIGQHYQLTALRIESDPLIELSAHGSYHRQDQQFDVAVERFRLKIAELLSRISGPLVQAVTATQSQGTIGLTLKAAGKIPQPADLERGNIAVQLESALTLNQVSGSIAGHRIENANGSMALSFQPETSSTMALATNIHVDNVQLANLPLQHAPDAFVNIDLTGHNFNELRIESAQLGMKGSHIKLRGSLTGLKPFLSGTSSMAALVERAFARVSTEAVVDLAHIDDLLAASGMHGSGSAQIDLSILKKERGPLDIKLDIGARDLHLATNGTTITDLDGDLIIHKQLAWQDDASPVTVRPFNPSDVLSQLRAHGGTGKRLTARRIDSGVVTLTDVSCNVLFDQSMLKIQNLAMTLLGGGLGGNIVVTAGTPFGVSAQLEAAQLDFNELVDDRHRIPGDSKVDATIQVSAQFDDKTGAIDLSHTAMNIYITHIGREALDRLLVFLDPEGSNPTLMAARAQVKLANPSSVTIQLARGLMGLDIRFSEGVLSSFTMNRIPIGSLAELHAVTQHIPKWNEIVRVMALIGASTYGVDADGHVYIQ